MAHNSQRSINWRSAAAHRLQAPLQSIHGTLADGRRRCAHGAAQMTGPLWSPTADRIGKSSVREYLNWLEIHEGRPFPDRDALWAWAVTNLDRFWSSVVDYYEVDFSAPWAQVRTADPMPHVRWFSGARLNWAQHALRRG